MSTFNIETTIKRLEKRKCLINGKTLLEHEKVVSKQTFPKLYDGKISKTEKDNISSLIKLFVKNKTLLENLNKTSLKELRGVFSIILNNDAKNTDEKFLQAYIYIFWKELTFNDSILKPSGDIYWTSDNLTEKPVGGQPDNIVKKISRLVNVDLISIDEKLGVIFLIEVKRENIDDRCIGQILRYYESCNNSLYRWTNRKDINYIRPVVISPKVDVNHWRGLPSSYRDVIDFYNYNETETQFNNEPVTFINARKDLLSSWNS